MKERLAAIEWRFTSHLYAVKRLKHAASFWAKNQSKSVKSSVLNVFFA
jgi:hypothetical protein